MADPATCSECDRYLAPDGATTGICVAKHRFPWQTEWYKEVLGAQVPSEACPDKKKRPPGQG